MSTFLSGQNHPPAQITHLSHPKGVVLPLPCLFMLHLTSKPKWPHPMLPLLAAPSPSRGLRSLTARCPSAPGTQLRARWPQRACPSLSSPPSTPGFPRPLLPSQNLCYFRKIHLRGLFFHHIDALLGAVYFLSPRAQAQHSLGLPCSGGQGSELSIFLLSQAVPIRTHISLISVDSNSNLPAVPTTPPLSLTTRAQPLVFKLAPAPDFSPLLCGPSHLIIAYLIHGHLLQTGFLASAPPPPFFSDPALASWAPSGLYQ